MAEALGVAASLAGLVTLAVQITQLSYSYVSDVKNAPRLQKRYLQEVSAFTDVLLRAEEASQDAEDLGLVSRRPASFSDNAISECRKLLASLQFELEKPTSRLLWPLMEKEVKKNIDSLQRFRSIFTEFVSANILIATNATYRQVEGLSHEQDRQKLLEWLRKPENTSKQMPSACPGTGQWFLDCDSYQSWCNGPPSVLWCHGPPGAGKSLLASITIHDLIERENIESACVIYYFCDFAARKQQDTETILQSLLRQMIKQSDHTAISALKKSQDNMGKDLTLKDVTEAFCIACATQKATYLVLDAPDELETPKKLLAHLQSFVEAGCRVLVTSRYLPDLRAILSTAKQMRIEAAPEDLKIFVESRFRENPFCDALTGNNGFVDAVIDKANGIFLLASVLVDQLFDLTTVKQMRRSLESLPTNLSDAFESSIKRIEAQPRFHSVLAHRLIGWITHSERRLKTAEVIHAFAVEEDYDEIDEENLTSIEMLLRVCVGLVTLNEDGTIGMVHTSAYEFFRNRESSTIQEDMARTCLQYLNTQPLTAGPCGNIDDMTGRHQQMPFLDYAAQYWGRHIETPDVEQKLGALIKKLLGDPRLRASAFQALHFRDQLKHPDLAAASLETIPTGQGPLHIAAYWNLAGTTATLIAEGENVCVTDSQKWSPLHWACSNGNLAVINALITGGADANARDSQGWTPLFWACFRGDTEIIRVLLEKGVNHVIRDIHGWTALQWAVSSQQEEAVKILLAHHAHFISENEKRPKTLVKSLSFAQVREYIGDAKRKAPMEIAAERGDHTLFNILAGDPVAESDINKIWSLDRFDTPISNVWRTMSKLESIQGQEAYLKHSGMAREYRDWKSRLLHVAIKDSKLLVVRLLIEMGADVNYDMGRTPLHAAAFRKDPRFVKTLLGNGANATLTDDQGLTALQQAVLNGFENTTIALLKGGSEVDARFSSESDSGRTRRSRKPSASGRKSALMLACGLTANKGDDGQLPSRIVRLLLSSGADVSLKDFEGMAALHYAARSGNADLIEQIIDAGAEVAEVDGWGRNVFHHFAEGNGSQFSMDALRKCVRLWTKHCDSDALNAEWDALERSRISSLQSNKTQCIHTPISLALEARNWKVFEILLESGAIMSTTYNLTPFLENAVRSYQLPAVRFLIAAGATLSPDSYSLDIFSKHGLATSPSVLSQFASILSEVVAVGVNVNVARWNGNTALLVAAREVDSAEVVQLLLDVGADLYHTNTDGLDAFLLAAIHGNLNTLHYLLTHATESPSEGHWTQSLGSLDPQHSSDHEDLARVCRALKRCNLVNKTKGNKSLLLLIAELGNNDMVRQLLACDADVEQSDEYGWRPLHIAAFRGHKEVVESLLQAGADVCAATERWNNGHVKPSGLYQGDDWRGQALHLASMMGHQNVVEILLANGADVNARTGIENTLHWPSQGPTALHIVLDTGIFYFGHGAALDGDRLNIADILVEHGADVTCVADHLKLRDIIRFKKHQQLWDKLRSGISDKGEAVPTSTVW